MDVQKIPHLDEVLSQVSPDSIISQTVRRLTAPGENYGSLMLSVDIKIKNSQGEEEEINAVAKLVPPNEYIQKVFNTQVTFRNEIAFYKHIVPTLHQFQREQGMATLLDCFPKYYGSRLNRTGSDVVDSDAVLLLENLKMAGFGNLDRMVGFDLEVSKVVVKDLAHLHAVSLALKFVKPEVFETNVKKYLTPFNPDSEDAFLEKMMTLISSIESCEPYLDRAKKALGKITERLLPPREPFATLIHEDFWVNNTMVKVEPGKPTKNKIVDFQICNYGSPARDLVFFLFSSVQNDVIKKHCDDLIKLYHDTFVSVLEQLKCDTKPFSFDNFQKEIDFEAANSQFGHIVFMLSPIFAPKGSVKELDQFSPEAFVEMLGVMASDQQRDKLELVVHEFARRNWI